MSFLIESPGYRSWQRRSSSPGSMRAFFFKAFSCFFAVFKYFSFDQCGLTGPRVQSWSLLVTVSKGDSLCFPKVVSLRFDNRSGRVLGQGKLKVSVILANCVLIMPLVLSINPDDWDDRCNENSVAQARFYKLPWLFVLWNEFLYHHVIQMEFPS